MQQRKPVWVCKACNLWHEVKPKECNAPDCNYRDFYYFPSTAEATRYAELRLLEKFKKIANLTCHPVFPIKLNGIHICKYIADFSYTKKGIKIVEDVKGNMKFATDVSKLKIKLAQAMHGVEVKIVESR